MKRLLLPLAGLLLALPLRAAEAEPRFPFVLPWDDASPGVTDMSGLLDKPAGARGFVTARDGHLYAGGKRIRFFGVNMAFGANFPTHEAAEKIAARLAKFGINCVRFHHMDNQPAPGGIWNKEMRALDPAQLDRLDYFIAQLKARGIYANLNLHVSRAYPGMARWKEAAPCLQGVDLFYPPILEMQRDYARQLLEHVNPYTGATYTNEPAVAIVEINNENGLIEQWWTGNLDPMPEPYRSALEGPWNRWLQTRYPSQMVLDKAWNRSSEPLGGEMLRNGDFAQGISSGWYLEEHTGAKASTAILPEGGGLRLHTEKAGQETWHVQLSQGKLAITKDQLYTIAFRARATGTILKLTVSLSQTRAPWRAHWSETVPLTPAWKEYRLAFRPSASDPEARLVFSNLGTEGADYGFAAVSLRPGGIDGLREGERLGAVPLFKKADFTTRTTEARRDWVRFLWETEEAYWTGMARFLKQDMKVRSVVVGTATGYSPSPIQAKLDAVDSHAYWQHPHFPGRPWDAQDWTVGSAALAGKADGGPLPWLALRRVEGKPFLCTEFNAARPNPHAAEAFLLSNAFAAFQDWDAVFAFAYSHRANDWDTRHITGFFDIDQDPGKLVTLPAAAAMFLRGDVAKAAATRSVPVSYAQAIERTCESGPWWNLEALGVKREEAFMAVTQMRPEGIPAASAAPVPMASFDEPQLVWDSRKARTLVDSPRSKAFIGTGTGEPVALGEVNVSVRGWAALALTAVDGPDFRSRGRVLIAATGSVESAGMRWKDAAKTSVGKNWGTAPTRAEGIAARVVFPVAASRLKAWALDERGQRGQMLPVQSEGPGAALDLGPAYKTLWYEAEIAP